MENRLLEQLMDRSIHSTDTKRINRSQVDLTKSMVITDVAKNSIASHLGLNKGDYLRLIDGEPASKIDFNRLGVEPERRTFEFFKPQQNELLRLTYDCAPLGLELAPTDEAVIQSYNWYSGDPNELIALWKKHRDQPIIQLVQKWVRKKVLYWERRMPSFINQVFLLNEREVLISGIGLYESDQYEAGIQYVDRFLKDYSHNWTADYTAIALYYMALEYKRLGQSDDAIEIMTSAYSHCPLKRIGNRLKFIGGVVEEEGHVSPWMNQTFPFDYELLTLNNPNTVKLSDSLNDLEDHQLHVVCSLGPYRSNGPYDEFMQRFIAVHRHFHPFFKGLHVITAGDRNPHWLDHEKLAISRKLPVSVLNDPDGSVMGALESTSSPELFYLDKNGVVISTQDLNSEIELWALLSNRMKLMTT